MLSTPPAFNLSQNQTLQFKSVAKISVGTEIRISKFLPVRYSLVNEPHRFTRREAVVYAASFSLSTSFFIFAKVFFAAPSGQLVGARETYVSFSNPRQELFFAIREIFFSRRPFGRGRLVGANGFMRLFNSTVKHFSAKNLWICKKLRQF